MTDRYAVFGNPIAHSKSPQIHTLFAQQTGQDIRYEKVLVDEDRFEAEAEAFFASGGKGLNITVPFKLDAYSFASRLTERARKAGAVNTLALQDDGSVLGDNTDGVGMVSDMIDNLGWELKHQRILILGAGGAVRGVLQPLLEQQPQFVTIANRTVEKALQLSKGFAELGYVCACGFDQLEGQDFDIIINGTSASLSGEVPPLPQGLARGARCYDMMYGAQPTVFLRWAGKNGAVEQADGLGMLVGQAAHSFRLWRGVSPKTGPVIQQLRKQLGEA